ncbi:MAG: hypothetical protein ABSD59_22765 [Terracidiphilus sp.]|jgi:hypothetical protein
MQNAHLRLGLLEYHRMTEKTSTRIRLRVDRYIGEDKQAHLISVFGNDSDVGAITAAVHEKATFTLTLPDGEVKEVSLGEHASCYKGAVSLQDRKHPVRHLVAVSEQLYTNGGVGRTILFGYQRDQAWATLVSFLGLPAEPSWAEHVLGVVETEERIKPLDGIGCQPVLISATTEEVLELIGDGLRSKALSFPQKNGPIIWPNRSWQQVMSAELLAA